jgi:type I restriction enzyme S subunit
MPRHPSPIKTLKGRNPIAQGDRLGSLANNAASPEGPEQGELPDRWKLGRLGELVERPQYGLTASATGEPKGPRFLRITDIQESGVAWRTVPYCECDADSAERLRLRPGDIVIARIGATTGKAHLIHDEVDAVFASYLIRLRAKGGLVPDFLAFFTSSAFYWRQIDSVKGGRLKKGINIPLLESLEIPLPPPAEQRAVAEVLWTVQRAKDATEKVIAATRQLKASLLKHLFTYGPVPLDQADQVPLKETEIGTAPAHWQIVRLGDKAAIGNGSTPKRTDPRYWEGGTLPWLTSGKIHERTIRQADEFVTEVARHECHLPLVPRGSLLVAITGQGKTLGNSAKVELDACVSQHLAYVSIQDADLLPDVALAFLRSRYDQLQAISRAGGSTKGALTCGFLKRFEIPMPPISEQRLIAAELRAVDAKMATEEQRRAALDALFKSLLHHLMTGKLRLPEFTGGRT